jgi:hypothetical protein
MRKVCPSLEFYPEQTYTIGSQGRQTLLIEGDTSEI